MSMAIEERAAAPSLLVMRRTIKSVATIRTSGKP